MVKYNNVLLQSARNDGYTELNWTGIKQDAACDRVNAEEGGNKCHIQLCMWHASHQCFVCSWNCEPDQT